MEPKFKQSYDVIVDKKKTHHRGEAVGIIGGSTGTIHKAIWSKEYHRWTYTLYPNYMKGDVTIFEDQLLPIKEWLKFSKETLEVIDYLTSRSLVNRHLSPVAMRILTKYKALLSGRVDNTQIVVSQLENLVLQIRESFDVYAK